MPFHIIGMDTQIQAVKLTSSFFGLDRICEIYSFFFAMKCCHPSSSLSTKATKGTAIYYLEHWGRPVSMLF